MDYYQTPKIKREEFWRDWFKDQIHELGFQCAYIRLQSYIKFHNYEDNALCWADESVIHYNAFDSNWPNSELFLNSCELANEAINKMINLEGATNG